MKVLMIANIPFPYIVDYFNELGQYCDLTVLFLRKAARNRDKSWLSDNIEHFKAIYLKGVEFGSENVLCVSVLKWLKPKYFDIICFDCYARATSILGIEYMNIIKAPFIISADGGFIKDDSILLNMLKKHLIGSAKYWISTGENTDKYLTHYGANISNIFRYPFTSLRKKDLVENILSKEEKQKLKVQLRIIEEKVVLSVGQFIPCKRFDVLIESAKGLPPNCGVHIVGGEPTKEYLSIIEEHGIKNVHFVPFRPKDQLINYFKAADLFVLPTGEDIWGLVINEAMAHGLPVITTDRCIAGLELVKNDENGYIIPVGDKHILSEKMNHIITNEQLQIKMAYESLKKIQDYTIEKMAKKLSEIFIVINSKT